MEKYDDENGVWRTIRGRRVFIREGESLGSAMARSGKFKREDIRESKRELSLDDRIKKSRNIARKTNEKNFDNSRRKIEKNEHKYTNKYELRDSDFKNQAEKNRIHEDRDEYLPGKTRVERNYPKYSKTDRREVEREELQKKLADYKAKKKGNAGFTLAEEERIRKNDLQIRKQESLNKSTLQSQNDKAKNEIEKFKAKKQSNNKIDNEYYGSKKAQLDLEMSKYTSKEKLERAKEKLQNSNLDKEERQYYQDYIEKREGTPIKDILKQSNNKVELSKKQIEASNKLNANAEKGARSDINTWLDSDEKDYGSFIKDLADEWNIDKDRAEKMFYEELDKKKKYEDSFKPSKEDWDDINHWYNDNPKEEWDKQSNSKINKLVKKGNTFIPVRENEKEKDVVRDYAKTNDKETMNRIKDLQYNEKMKQLGIRQSLGEKGQREVEEAQARRGKLINFTLNNKEQIREWAKDYDKEKVGKKVMNNEPLTMKEYFGYIASNPKEGDIILAGGKNGEDVRVGKNGKLETIKNYVEKKKSNKKLSKADEKYESTKKDVLEYFSEDFGYENTTPEKALVEQIDYMRIPGHSIYQTAKEYAEGGNMLIYNQDMADYLKTKGIKATENNAFGKYTDYMAKNIEKMYNEFKKKGK